MSNPTPANENHDSLDEESLRYLTVQWRVDPFHQADDVLTRRNAFLGKRDWSYDDAILPTQAERDQAMELFEETRKHFWSLAAGEVQSRLESAVIKKFADLSANSRRLCEALPFRQELLSLCQAADAGPLYENLRQMIQSPPRESAGIHESIVRRVVLGIGEKGLGAYWKPEKTLRGNAKRIRKAYPRIYHYFRDLIEDILTAGNIKSSYFSFLG
jgi:hypothetical protein